MRAHPTATTPRRAASGLRRCCPLPSGPAADVRNALEEDAILEANRHTLSRLWGASIGHIPRAGKTGPVTSDGPPVAIAADNVGCKPPQPISPCKRYPQAEHAPS